MIKKITKRLLNITLCELLWLILIAVTFSVVLMYSDVNESSTPKTTLEYPVVLWWTMEFPGTSNVRHCSDSIKCYVYSDRRMSNIYNTEAYLFYASNIDFKNLPTPRRPDEIIWALFHEESPRNVEEFLHEKALNLFNFSSTFSRHSNVPFPLQHLYSYEDITSTRYFVSTRMKNVLLKEIAPILYLQSDCETSTERDSYVIELMKYTKVDSYGKCLKNKDLPQKFKEDYLNNLNEESFLHFIARYKFVIAIENGVCNDYVTEKFWRAIKVGTVPIYFGSPSIKDWFPNKKSGILLEDYPTPNILHEHLMVLMKNDSLYEEYLEHKTKQIIANENLMNEYRQRPYQLDGIKTMEKFECFVCEKLYDKMRGETQMNVVNKSHYDCPKPLSALTLGVNPQNSWVFSWETAEINAETIYKDIMNRD